LFSWSKGLKETPKNVCPESKKALESVDDCIKHGFIKDPELLAVLLEEVLLEEVLLEEEIGEESLLFPLLPPRPLAS
jgi:hypothetical protein